MLRVINSPSLSQLITLSNNTNEPVSCGSSENNESVITNISRISKPGLRVYSGAKKMPRILGGFGTAIVSTSRGLMTDQQARQEGVGGELLCYIW